jgi:ParB-like chromosome segregation protein Spo0J
MENNKTNQKKPEAPLASDVKIFKISDIKIGPQFKLRGDITSLSESIQRNGVLEPLLLNNREELLAGFHRLEAAKAIGMKHVPVRILHVNSLQEELVTIDENLERKDLPALDRCIQMGRRQEILGKLGVIHKKGGDRKSKKIKKQKIHSDRESFKKVIKKMTGRSHSSTAQDLFIANKLSKSVLKKLSDSELKDRKNDLYNLAKKPANEQLDLVKLIHGGKLKTLREAEKKLNPALEPDATPPIYTHINELGTYSSVLAKQNRTITELLKLIPRKPKTVRKTAKKMLGAEAAIKSTAEKITKNCTLLRELIQLQSDESKKESTK